MELSDFCNRAESLLMIQVIKLFFRGGFLTFFRGFVIFCFRGLCSFEVLLCSFVGLLGSFVVFLYVLSWFCYVLSWFCSCTRNQHRIICSHLSHPRYYVQKTHGKRNHLIISSSSISFTVSSVSEAVSGSVLTNSLPCSPC